MGIFDDDSGMDLDADLITQLMGDAGEPSGPDETTAFASTIMASPFYKGVPSHSGAGQISEAILPIVLGLMAGKEAEKKQKAAAAAQTLKTYLTLAQVETQRARLGVEQEKLAQKKSDRALEEQYRGRFEASSLPDKSASMKVGGVTLTKGVQDQSLGSAMKEGMTGLGQIMAGKGYKDILDSFKAAGVYPDTQSGMQRIFPPDDVYKMATNRLANVGATFKTMDRAIEIAAKNPQAFGLAGMAGRTVQGARSQAAAIGLTPGAAERRKPLVDLANSARADIKSDLKARPETFDPEFQYDKWFNPALNEIDTLRNMIAYQVARLNDDNGRLSDFDVQNALESIEGKTWFQGMFSSNQAFIAGLNEVKRSVGKRIQDASGIVAERARASNAAREMMGLPPMPAALDFSSVFGAGGDGPAKPAAQTVAPKTLRLDPKTVPVEEAIKALIDLDPSMDDKTISDALTQAGYE